MEPITLMLTSGVLDWPRIRSCIRVSLRGYQVIRSLSCIACSVSTVALAMSICMPAHASAATVPRLEALPVAASDGRCFSPSIDQSIQYAPAPTSLLVSRGDLQFSVGRVLRDKFFATVVAYETPAERLEPTATISLVGAGSASRICIDLLARPDVGADRTLAVATLEHLYGLVLRQDPEAAYCLADNAHRCMSNGGSLSQGDLLHELVLARERSIGDGPGDRVEKPWQVVALAPNGKNSSDDEVRVRIADKAGPMPGATVFFHRAPHSGCKATSRADGGASCHLVDLHGDDDSHDDDDAKLVVTFPGEIGVERILVPITFVMPMKQ